MYLETLTPFSPRRDPRSSEATLWTIWRAWEVKTRMGMLMWVEAQTWNTTCIPSHGRLWVNTHTVLLTLRFFQERSDLFLLVLFTFDDTHWDIWVCVSWKSFCNAHPPLHGLCIPLDTHHVQMSFFTPFHVVQTPFPSHSIPHPNHSFL